MGVEPARPDGNHSVQRRTLRFCGTRIAPESMLAQRFEYLRAHIALKAKEAG
ncbi:hypothetical protein [Tateyamaria pelophila]|uniref:hypothetical protein n=1 Tax=Tateyamaria pelophila TaxID=328415 RepID=UPI001CBB6270|nr:hypothetical protein [Tateyamaria pelophila]